MLSNNNLKAVCTVTELVKKLGLSRARFYQLLKMGIFPKPVYCIRTRRPIYTLDLQQECIAVRKMGIGHNGQPILFYAQRENGPKKHQAPSKQWHKELAGALEQMGLKMPCKEIKNALEDMYPDSVPQHIDKGILIRDMVRYFNQKL